MNGSPVDRLDAAACCPRCEAPNGCAIAAGGIGTACWCAAVAFAPESLAGMDPDRCLCRACAERRP